MNRSLDKEVKGVANSTSTPNNAASFDEGTQTPMNERYMPAYELLDGTLERAGRGTAAKIHAIGFGLATKYDVIV